MPNHSAPKNPKELRENAEVRLQSGTAPPFGGASDVNALTMLFQLASSPESASAALKFLHELQVHQVEIDLQREEMERSWRAMSDDLERYSDLFAFAPVGYFSIGPQDKIIEANIAGANLFGVERVSLWGRRIDEFLASASRPLLRDLLQRRRAGGPEETCEVYASGDADYLHPLHVAVNSAPGGQSLLVMLMELH